MAVNIPSQLVVQDAATWAADSTVYTDKRILITSDVFYSGTDQPRFKFANGVDTWANLDYVPEGGGGTNFVTYFHINNYTFPDGANAKIDQTASVSAGVLYDMVPLPACTLKAVYAIVSSNSTIASGEDNVLKLISNGGVDSFTIASDFKLNANRTLYQEYTGLNQAITAGGSYIQIDVGTLATNPAATKVKVILEIEL